MSVFGKYSSYYNLLYKDKDYAGETEYVHNLIQKHFPKAKSILDLGCGTGRHDCLLAGKGYLVTGVDMSEEMLAVAKAQLSTFNLQPSTLNFLHHDIRTVRLNNTFDVVISLFHVMSYQTSNDDLKAAFETAKAHLGPGGIFIFDCWYGPAVLTDPPVVRVKRLEDENIALTRIAEPVIYPNENLVDVQYSIFVRDKKSDGIQEIRESHCMRYLFMPEISRLLAEAGMEMIFSAGWLTDRGTGCDTWYACFGGRVASTSK